jgi:hypothetical protein
MTDRSHIAAILPADKLRALEAAGLTVVEREWIEAIPDSEAPRFNGGVRCDVVKGPCACGAWHQLAEREGR